MNPGRVRTGLLLAVEVLVGPRRVGDVGAMPLLLLLLLLLCCSKSDGVALRLKGL